jgi:hypothetical protein
MDEREDNAPDKLGILSFVVFFFFLPVRRKKHRPNFIKIVRSYMHPTVELRREDLKSKTKEKLREECKGQVHLGLLLTKPSFVD